MGKVIYGLSEYNGDAVVATAPDWKENKMEITLTTLDSMAPLRYEASCWECNVQHAAHKTIALEGGTWRMFWCFAGPSVDGERIAAEAERHHRETGHFVRFLRQEQKYLGEPPADWTASPTASVQPIAEQRTKRRFFTKSP